jgi:2-succinyl-5-enolpyruvyl-6-hydroxy-3-cyclohexene-1-carboxylate synthase
VTAAIQTIWSELVVATLADLGVRTCVVSPGSRSAPLVAALARDGRFDLPSIIDERAAAFFALGVARATGEPAALACTSGSAAAHYLPAIVEASLAGVPLIAITADRPPELHGCGASQTIDQAKLYGGFVRAAFELGAPVATPAALAAVRRTVMQAVTLARGPHPGPVHINVALRKPLEPAAPATDDERALARAASDVRARSRAHTRPPRLVADSAALDALAAAIESEPHGMFVVGAMPTRFGAARDAVLALAHRAGYPVLAEAGSQLRGGNATTDRRSVVASADLVLGSPRLAGAPAPRLVVRIGAEPVAAGWAAARAALATATTWVLADHGWSDPDSSAHAVIVGDVATSIDRIAERVPPRAETSFVDAWRAAGERAAAAIELALAAHPGSEGAAVRAAIAAVPPGTILQLGNSLPIRIVDQVCDRLPTTVIVQRGAAGIDGLVASAAGATRAHAPVLLVLGDVSFAHDLGGVLAARACSAPLAIVVLDNGGGQIFAGLPIARAGLGDMFDRHFVTAPMVDPTAVAVALGVRAITATSAAAIAAAVAVALDFAGPTIIHAPVTASGAHDVRRDALARLAATTVDQGARRHA